MMKVAMTISGLVAIFMTGVAHADAGTLQEIRSIRAGKVTEIGQEPLCPNQDRSQSVNYVEVLTAGFYTRYRNLTFIDVNKGDIIRENTIIGLSPGNFIEDRYSGQILKYRSYRCD